MEFFDLFNLVQMFLPSGTINVSVEIQPQIEALVASYRQSMLICLGVAAGIYLICLILGGIGMHVMAKKRGMKGSWMAFVPFLNTLYAGKLAGEVNVFGKKVKWMGLAATFLEFVYVGLSAFSCYLLFSLLQPGYFTYRTANTIGGEAYYQAELVTERVPLGMRWMLTADTVCEILIYVFYILMLLAMCLMFYSFYRKYYARSPFIMMFLSALFPFRGIVIFAVRNNAPVDYDAWMRRKMEEFNRRQQQNRPGNYGGYGGYGDQGGYGGYGGQSEPGSYGGTGGQGGTGENPFPDFGGANGSGDSGNGSDSPFSDF